MHFWPHPNQAPTPGAEEHAMPDAIPACFRVGRGIGVIGDGDEQPGHVRLQHAPGLAALSCSRAAVGLSLRAVLRVSSSAAPTPSPSASDYGDGGEVEYECDGDEEEATVAVRVRPWRHRWSKRFRCVVDLARDLSPARASRRVDEETRPTPRSGGSSFRRCLTGPTAPSPSAPHQRRLPRHSAAATPGRSAPAPPPAGGHPALLHPSPDGSRSSTH